MICDFCHEREAAIYLEQVSSDGLKKKVNICMECAMKRGISTDPKSITSSIGELFKELSVSNNKIQSALNKLCPVCGTKLASIQKTGITGCPECYSVFKKEIDAYMKLKGISSKYTGSMPLRLSNFRSVLNDRILLRDKMNEAVKNEDYEKAAIYRDYLKALSKNAVEEGSDDNFSGQ